MSRIIVSCILCVAAFCLQASDIIQVSAGTDVTVNGDKISVGDVERNNTRSTVLDFAGNSTITVKSGIVSFGIIATNGIVTLDLTEIGNAEFTLNNGAVVKGDGRLVVKGRDSLCVGSKTITENNFAPPAGIVNVEYRNSDGNAYDNPEGLILVGRVLEWELPTASPWKMDASTVPCILHNDSKIVQSMMTEDGKVSLENREMWIYEIDAFPTPETPVYVGSGSEMVVILRMVKPDEYFEQSGYNGYALTNSIEVAEGGVLNLRSHKFTLAGAVSGPVKVLIVPEYPFSTAVPSSTTLPSQSAIDTPSVPNAAFPILSVVCGHSQEICPENPVASSILVQWSCRLVSV